MARARTASPELARTLLGDLLAATRHLVDTHGQQVANFRVWWEVQVALYAAFHQTVRREEDGQRIAQELFDLMAYDWDQSLRTQGAGDGKTIKIMRHLGSGFYGRLTAYQTQDNSLCDNLISAGLAPPAAQAIAHRVRALKADLHNSGRGELLGGQALQLCAKKEQTK